MSRAAARRGEQGFSLVAALSIIAIMMILMGAAVPSWRYVMKNAREEELLFRGLQIADAVERYQKKHGGAPPNSIEDLVKGRFLRKAWKDPMTRDGKWRLLRQGEIGPLGLRARSRRAGRDVGGPGGELGGAGGRSLGVFVGVASTSTDESFRMFNGQTTYDEWYFAPGLPRVVGPQRTFAGVPGLPGRIDRRRGGTEPGPAMPQPQKPDR